MKRIYVAGKLNGMAVDYIANCHRMMRLAENVRRAGFAVYVPCVDVLMGMMFGDYAYEDYFNNSQPFLEVCDAMIVVLEGAASSRGTQKEIAFANDNGIPVFWSLEELKAWDQKRPTVTARDESATLDFLKNAFGM